jgi:aspartyl-tRNA(Asn)/glutamyl-tRNA(Gln) amidotransferase subunit A
VAFASSLDHIGPFGRTVADAAALLEAIAGRDEMDATSASAPVPSYQAALNGDVRGMKLGLPKEYFAGLASETGDRQVAVTANYDAPGEPWEVLGRLVWAGYCGSS